MFPVSLEVIYVSIAGFAVIGAVVGMLTGILASSALNLGRRWIVLDALLGLMGLYLGLLACSFITFEPPFPLIVFAAVIFSAALPVLRQIYRFKRLKSAPR